MSRQPVVLYGNREVRCAHCRTDDEWGLPAGSQRTDENHFSVRFGDQGSFRVYFNGDDVTNLAYECVAGYSGWVAMYLKNEAGQRITCQLGEHHALLEKQFGFVQVSKVLRVDRLAAG